MPPGNTSTELDPAFIRKFAANAEQFITYRRDLAMPVFREDHDPRIFTDVGLWAFLRNFNMQGSDRTIVNTSTAECTGLVDHRTICQDADSPESATGLTDAASLYISRYR